MIFLWPVRTLVIEFFFCKISSAFEAFHARNHITSKMCFEFNWMEAQVAKILVEEDASFEWIRALCYFLCPCLLLYHTKIHCCNFVCQRWLSVAINGAFVTFTPGTMDFWFVFFLFAIIFHKHVERQPIVIFGLLFPFLPLRRFPNATKI